MAGVLVTGIAGFIGAHVAARLAARGDEVVGIDNIDPYYDPRLKRARLQWLADRFGRRITFIPCDFTDAPMLRGALSEHRIDRIVHLGAQPGVRYSIENPEAYVRANVAGHLNVLEVARHRPVGSMVYASSSSVYGANARLPFSVDDRADHPVSLYAATKKSDELTSEAYASLYRLPQTGLRLFTVYGPWGRPDMAIWRFTEAMLRGEPIDLYNGGRMQRDFTYIDDIAAGVVAALDRPPLDDGQEKPGGSRAPHALYNMGGDRPEPLARVVALIEAACGRKAVTRELPMQAGDVPATWADINATARDLGYAPSVPIDIGIPRFVAWYRSRHGS